LKVHICTGNGGRTFYVINSREKRLYYIVEKMEIKKKKYRQRERERERGGEREGEREGGIYSRAREIEDKKRDEAA